MRRAVTDPREVDLVVGLQERELELLDQLDALGRIGLARLLAEQLVERVVLPAAVVAAAEARIALAQDLIRQRSAERDRMRDELEVALVLQRVERTGVAHVDGRIEADGLELCGEIDRG